MAWNLCNNLFANVDLSEIYLDLIYLGACALIILVLMVVFVVECLRVVAKWSEYKTERDRKDTPRCVLHVKQGENYVRVECEGVRSDEGEEDVNGQ